MTLQDIRTCTKNHCISILGIDCSELEGLFRAVWKFPKEFVATNGPQYETIQVLKNLDLHWKKNSENTTRTFIDLVLADVLARQKTELTSQALVCFGGLPLKWPLEATLKNKIAGINGISDYCIGYDNEKKTLDTLLFVIEAKRPNEKWNIYQLIGYMGILQQHRIKKMKKRKETKNCTIYGILSDSELWQFFRLDNFGKAWSSEPLYFPSRQEEIWNWINFLIDCSKNSTPSATPTASISALHHFERDVEKFEIDYDFSDTFRNLGL